MALVGAISQRIWDMKYRLRAPANGDVPGEALDKTIEDTWRRVAAALAATEQEPAKWAERFYGAMEDFKFLPAGRVIAGAGSSRSVTLFNCFVMGAIPDDMGGIFAHLREAALTMQQGGGIGYDFSTLRPRGAPVKGMMSQALVFRSPMCATCGTTGTKSVPGFAVPDSVHQVKPTSPRTLPTRRTTTRALASPAATSTVAVVISIKAGFDQSAGLADVLGAGVAGAAAADSLVGAGCESTAASGASCAAADPR